MKPQEKILREYIKQYLKELKEAEKDDLDADVVDEPQQDEPIANILEPLVLTFVKKVKNNISDINSEVIQEVLIELLNNFSQSTDEKLNIIKNVKNTIIGY